MISTKHSQIISMVIIGAAIYFSFSSLMPSLEQDKETKSIEFSNAKALVHLQNISKKPHYTGSKEHTIVRNYLVKEFEKLGLIVEIQEQVVVNKRRTATNSRNILARIKGTGKGKALLLLSHYDSSPHSSLGASDAGSGVAAILEGVRAFLMENPAPKNDVIICISDAEELGLLGANAFVNHHPWAKDVGLVLNFEARGSGGPSYMFIETNGGNKNLIKAFKKANSPFPVANSLVYSIYKMLPNDTDLTVFREEGDIEGFNFAFIGDHFDYHTSQDSFERMDLNTFQHQASYLVAMLNYFSEANLSNLKAEEDYVYFDFPFFGMVIYPFAWAIPMVFICSLLFLILVTIGFLNKKLTIAGVLKGFIPFVLSIIVSGFIAIYGWKLLLKIHPSYNDILQGFTYNGYYYIAVFISLTLSICFWFYKGAFKKRTAQDIVIAPIFIWLILNVVIAFYLPGASFFIIPIIILLFLLVILLFSELENKVILFSIAIIPILIIFSPLVKTLPVGLGLKMMFVSVVLIVLIFGLLTPIFQQYKNQRKIPYLFLLIGLMTLISATLKSGYSESQKQPNSIVYVLDTNSNKAYWESYNNKVDEFTRQFLGDNPSEGSYTSSTSPSKYKSRIKLHKSANLKKLTKPEISIVSDTIIGSDRIVEMRIFSNRNANKIQLMTNTPIEFKLLRVNGELLKNTMQEKYIFDVNLGYIMSYIRTAKEENLNLEFIVDSNQKFDIDVLESKFDLLSNPEFNITPRTNQMMPTPFVLNDATIIKTNLKF